MGDVDGDGDSDLLFGRRLWINQREILRSEPTTLPDISGLVTDRDLVANFVDIDGDGDRDVADSFGLLINAGQGSFPRSSIREYSEVAAPDLVFTDLDLDGNPDLVTGKDSQFTRTPIALQNHQRQLNAPFFPQLGLPYRLDAYAETSYATQSHPALIFSSFASALIDLPPIGLLRLDPASLRLLGPVEILPEDGVASLQLNIPATPALLDRDLFIQTVILTGSDLALARFTNSLHEVILPR